MQLFRQKSNDEAEDVRWLAPTQVRQRPRRRLLPFSLLATAVVGAAALMVVSFRLSGPAPDAARPQSTAPASTPPRVQAPAPVAPAPTARPPMPDIRAQSEPPPAELRAPDPAPLADPAAAPDAAQPNAEPAPTGRVTGAFPPASAPASDDPEAPEFAAYLNESAPDQDAARTLVGDAQRRYASALEGGRLSYRRVRLADGTNVWRLRLSGLTRAAAERVCASLAAAGEGCEVGPR